MKILVTGSTGFIGRRLTSALHQLGHEVVCVVRCPSSTKDCGEVREADFAADIDPAVWVPRLEGIDVVVNAVGIIRERGRQTFEAVHHRAPAALFLAAAQSGVRRIVQISALGADERAISRYHLSKKAADDVLTTLPVDWVIAQPSLVFGPGGASARLFTLLAGLPRIVVPGRGDYEVQPIHIDDAVAALVALIVAPQPQRHRVALVGRTPIRFADFLIALRRAMGMHDTRVVRIPEWIVRAGARVAAFLPGSLLDSETLAMLMRGNTAAPGATRGILGRDPRPTDAFIADPESARAAAQLAWLVPILRLSLALVWIVTGVLSLGVYPTNESYRLLARVGIVGAFASIALYGGAVLDLALGFATLLLRKRAWLWVLQGAVIVAYTLIITVKLPKFWLHPYGPILKNIPMLAMIWLLHQLERR